MSFDPKYLPSDQYVTVYETTTAVTPSDTNYAAVGGSVVLTFQPPKSGAAVASTRRLSTGAASPPPTTPSLLIVEHVSSSDLKKIAKDFAVIVFRNQDATIQIPGLIVIDTVKALISARIPAAGLPLPSRFIASIAQWIGAATKGPLHSGLVYTQSTAGFSTTPIPNSSCLHPVFVLHGILSDVESTYGTAALTALFQNDHYDCVIGYDYDWTDLASNVAPKVAAALNAWMAGRFTSIDVVAHSYGTVVATETIPLLHVKEVQNLMLARFRGQFSIGHQAADAA